MRRMKAYARLAIQFLVAYAMVFQQMPVAAFAQQAAAEGSAGAAQPAEQQEAAAPGAEETQPAEAPAAEDAQPLAADSPDAAQAAAETGQWGEFGTCLWSIDGDGLLTIKPEDESAGGEIGTDWWYVSGIPWESRQSEIKSVKFLGKIRAVNNIETLFNGCANLESIDFGELDTSGVTDMSSMFSGCSSLASLDLSAFDTSKVTNMSSMFQGCSSLTSLDLSAFDTSKVSIMTDMFSGCSSLASLDLSSFDTSSVTCVTCMRCMFDGCSSLTRISLGKNFAIANGSDFRFPDNSKTGRWVSSADGVAYESTGIPNGVAATYTQQKTNKIKNVWNQCGTCLWLLNNEGTLTIKPQDGKSGVLNGWGYDQDAPAWLRLRNQIKTVAISDGVAAGESAGNLFKGCSRLEKINIEALDTSRTEYMSGMFEDCSSLKTLNLSSFNTSNAVDMQAMFSGCRSLKKLDLSSFNTIKVTDMSSMFYDCDALRSVDISSFRTPNVSSMGYMFSGCSSLSTIDVSQFDTSSATYMSGMFSDCASLKELDLSSFDTSASTDLGWFFGNCTSLQKVILGADFCFVGEDSYLPSQLDWSIPITWQNSSGKKFASKDIPSYTADTYRMVVGSVPRLAGYTRYETAGQLFDQGNWQNGGALVLASGNNFPDALAAAALAGDLNAPIMLTSPGELSEETAYRIQNYSPSKVYIIGGNAAVSPNVERRVAELLGSSDGIKRIAGSTRYDTSLKVASELSGSSDTVIVATGTNYADALSISPYAFATGSPVLLCDPRAGLSDDAIAAIKKAGYEKAVIVGGTAAVPQKVEGQLRGAGTADITRLAGSTRYDTSAKIAKFELKSGTGFTPNCTLLATGRNFPDALAAGPLAGKRMAPLLLVDPGASQASDFMAGFKGDVSQVTVVGGTSAVSDADAARIAGSLGIG